MIKPMIYCSRCVYPKVSVNLHIDEEGICSSCRAYQKFDDLTPEFWAQREKKFAGILKEYSSRNTGNYDCVIGVSGGKDSYYQAHVMASDYGLKPLLVTYHGNNYLPEGDYNRDRLRKVFDADHIVMGPSQKALIKLNRLCFRKMGDMNWHNHCGIMTFPVIIAAKFNIPLVIWGETPWDQAGMFDPDDFVEFTARMRHEHALRGFEWYDMLNDSIDTLVEKDLVWGKYPSDDEILKAGVRGLYIGNFFKWLPYEHTKLIQNKYDWIQSKTPFERTYRMISNLDDRYENGIHDLLKFLKFGYGRASDHASKDIRAGDMTREMGVEMVRKYDSVVSSDLEHWLNYVDMTESEFWEIADTFRDPRVWWVENGQWHKYDVWGGSSAYGKVHLTKEQQVKYANS